MRGLLCDEWSFLKLWILFTSTPPNPRASGGDDRDRTDDPLLAKQVLSQLSYAPNRRMEVSK